MRFSRLIVAAALTSSTILAQSPGAPALELSGKISNPTPTTGQMVRFDVTLRNEGPRRVTNAWTELRVEGGLITDVRCDAGPGSLPFQNPARCVIASLTAGQQATYSVDVFVKNSASALSFAGWVFTYFYKDANSDSTSPLRFSFDVPVSRSPRVVDLELTAREAPTPIPVNSEIRYETTITNHGPDDATDVLLLASEPFGVELSGVSGAACELVERLTICRVGFMATGTTATIGYTRAGVMFPTQAARFALVTASTSFDPTEDNSEFTRQVLVGIPSELTRVLLPITSVATAGANDSRWVSETSLFLDSGDELLVFPTEFVCQITCETPTFHGDYVPPRRLWRPLLWTSGDNPGRILRFDRSRADELTISSRVRDTSRELDTWGTTIPVVKDDDLIRGNLQLIDIAAGPRFRQTLRIYEPDATGAKVHVRVWGEDGVERLIGEADLVLSAPPENTRPDRNAGLPFAPGHARIDLGTRFSDVDQYARLRIEIEADSPDTRYWAFVSITNNDTQHVTLVTPGRGDSN